MSDMIGNACVIPRLRLRKPGFRAKLKNEDLEAFAKSKGADVEALTGGAILAPKKLTEPLNKAYWAARNGFRQEVLPFPEDMVGTAAGLVTAEYFHDFANKVNGWKRDFEAAVNNLCDHWDEVLRWQQQALAGVWEERFAMSTADLRSKCAFEFTVQPCPSGKTFPPAMRHFAEALDAQVQTALEDAQQALMEKFLERVRWLAESLEDEEATFNKSRGEVSPREKMAEFVKSLPAMSLVKDPVIDALVQEVLSLTAMQHDTEVLRNDKDVRADAAIEAMETVRRIEELMQGV